ncbi:hypothetical protein [Burkholderia ubonensis]|uniref:hypothetical protein n=1 Tax=Burkholderia ubonensis TaxID=101571 RepID=UPI000A8EB60B|nr:hypothetical protein [Burkholderia ubonensis]
MAGHLLTTIQSSANSAYHHRDNSGDAESDPVLNNSDMETNYINKNNTDGHSIGENKRMPSTVSHLERKDARNSSDRMEAAERDSSEAEALDDESCVSVDDTVPLAAMQRYPGDGAFRSAGNGHGTGSTLVENQVPVSTTSRPENRALESIDPSNQAAYPGTGGQTSTMTGDLPSTLTVLNNRSKRENRAGGLSRPSQSNDAPSSTSSDADASVAAARTDALAPPATDAPSAIALESDRASEATRQQDVRRQLAELDTRLGPLRFGESSVSRAELLDMGATIDGAKISIENSSFAAPDRLIVDSLQFDQVALGRHLAGLAPERVDDVLTLLFEVSVARSPSAPSVLGEVPASNASPIAKMNVLLNNAQALDVNGNSPIPAVPGWVDTVKSQVASKLGGSLQAYGIYAGILGLRDAVIQGDAGEAGVAAGGIGAELASMFVEHSLEKTGARMLENGGKVLGRFASTSVGKALVRGGGLIANALTLPFDIHGAVNSFKAAAQATGKEKQDQYVAAGFSLTSAGLSLLLGAASAAGFASTAGPVGLAAATLMIAGAQVYGAVRQVDNIDDYIALSNAERWQTGWRAFWGKKPDENVMDRFKIAYAEHAYTEHQKREALRILESEEKIGSVINGSFNVALAPVKRWKHEWDESKGELPYTVVKEPVVNEADDDVDASHGIDASMSGVVTGAQGKDKIAAWRLGGGNDRVVGVQNQTNWFQFSGGTKVLTGGHQNDYFGWSTAGELLKNERQQQASESVFDGGAGIDTLSLLGMIDRDGHAYSGFDMDLKAGRLGMRRNSTDNELVPLARLTSIENVETVAGASSRVMGSDDANQIVVRGDDRVDAAAGNDTIHIHGYGTVHGGSGTDRYIIEQGHGMVDIVEDGKEDSEITLKWNLENIVEWRVEGNDLIVSSQRGVDRELPGRTVRVAGVYREENGTRVLQNDKLTFHTEDGYTVAPDLPAELAGDQPSAIKAIISRYGKVAPPPTILASGVTPVSDQHASFYVGKGNEPVTLDVQTSDQAASSTIYLDYNESEIDKVEYHYTSNSNRIGNSNHLKYGDANLVVTMKNGKVLTINNVASNRDGRGTNVGGNLIASGFGLNHSFAITLQDGTSYRVKAPQNSYYDDHINPGNKIIDGTPSLKLRYGKYAFNNPAVSKIVVDEKPLHIPASLYPVTYELEGGGSTYDVYPRDGTTLRLSTAGANAQQSNASTWNLHVETLDDVDVARDATLDESQLRIRGITVYFPAVDDADKPLERIRIISRSGAYVVDNFNEEISMG